LAGCDNHISEFCDPYLIFEGFTLYLAILCMGMGLLLIPGIKEVILDPASAVLIKGAQYAQDALVLH
jgi:hypothetical protein